MNLKPTEEQQALIEALRDFAVNEIRPSARESEDAGQVSDRIVKQLWEMGIASPVPEKYGGQGIFDAVTSVIVAEEVAWGDPGTAFQVLGAGLPASVIDAVGTEDQRAELLPKFVDGHRGSLALAERDAGADFTQLEATATPAGDAFTLSGIKYGVVDFESAVVRLAVARFGQETGVFLISFDAEVQAQPEDKLGLRGARTFKVTLDGAGAALLGGKDFDRKALNHALLRAKLLNAGISVGLARAALEYATKYAQERTAFGRPIGAFQGISFKIADRAMDLETARLMAWKAAWSLDNDRPDTERAVFAACTHAVAAAVAAADDGVQILGGHGYMKDHPEEMWYRDALTLATFDSPSMVGDVFLASSYKEGER